MNQVGVNTVPPTIIWKRSQANAGNVQKIIKMHWNAETTSLLHVYKVIILRMGIVVKYVQIIV